ncbi:hypothetical protein C475_14528 [Halosimplex carlsbadense 2-9-1]|uniref:Uncharacterized protein n=1 Tax=Halosimplex carlsbadense 2-9-1 TaxID=797114 RepID=M0CMA5_9EURY|nr:hypothetical protein [Halosimplex carlsbadense]ELZ23497.1 hypothetical protein C475_14528 [Halosimplex carlsbadense 2-9-1]
MVEPGDYVDGVTIRWGRVASTLFGATILAYFQGAAAAFLSLADIPLGLLGGLGEFLGSLVAVVTGIWPALIRGGWAGAAGFVLEAGVAGYAVAIGLVLVTFYVATVVIRSATN